MRFYPKALAALSLSLILLSGTAARPVAAASAAAVPGSSSPTACCSKAALELHDAMRKLWTEQVIYTKSYIVRAVAGMDDQGKVLERLLRNQQDIGNAIKPYYGDAAGEKLTALLREHILLAGKIVDAAKAGNQTDFAKLNKEWYRNADDIAKLLASANPNWSEKTWRELMYAHLQLITEGVASRLKKDWDSDIRSFDLGIDHILMIADYASNGIVMQFPDKFNCRG